MATSTSLSKVALLAATVLVLCCSAANDTRPEWIKHLDADELDLVGYAGHIPDSTKPKVTAFFPHRAMHRARGLDSSSRTRPQTSRCRCSAPLPATGAFWPAT